MELLTVKTLDDENPNENDLMLRGGDFVWSTDRGEEVDQRIRARLRFFQGEWFADAREGVPYYQRLLARKDTTDILIRSVFSRLLRTTPGVVASEVTRVEINKTTRQASVSFIVRFDDGFVFTRGDSAPFLLRF